MRIDGITCCVGEKYALQLTRSLQRWLETLDSLTIVTAPGDSSIQLVTDLLKTMPAPDSRPYSPPCCELKIITTNVFYEHGAKFNKAAALCEAYQLSNPTDWVLHFDSDIIPPEYWRWLAEKRIGKGNLYGAFRYNEEGRRLDEFPLFPYGYFHLWHVDDPCAWRWPIFETWHPHAGNYDSEFAMQWPSARRGHDLGFSVLHQGEPRQSWFGPNDSESMQGLHNTGLYHVRLLAKEGVGILSIPEPLLRFYLLTPEADPQWTKSVLRLCAEHGPFKITAGPALLTIDKLRKVPLQNYQAIDPSVPVSQIEERISRVITNS